MPSTWRPSNRRRWRSRSAPAPTWCRTSRSAKASPSSAIRIYWGKALPINRGLWNFDERAHRLSSSTRIHSKRSRLVSTTCAPSGSDPLEDAIRYPAVRCRAHRRRNLHGRPAQTGFGLRIQHAAPNLPPIFACGRQFRCCSISSGSTAIFSTVFISAARASSMTPNYRPIIGRPTRTSAHCWRLFPDAVRPDVLDGTWSPPATDGSDHDRAVLRRALAPLQSAGYVLQGMTLRESFDRPAIELRDHGGQSRR